MEVDSLWRRCLKASAAVPKAKLLQSPHSASSTSYEYEYLGAAMHANDMCAQVAWGLLVRSTDTVHLHSPGRHAALSTEDKNTSRKANPWFT